LAIVLAHVIAWQFVELAKICRDGIACGVLAGFLDGLIDTFDFDRR
jgi:hypothetical protein